MLISKDGDIRQENHCHAAIRKRYKYYLNGFLFVSGRPAGRESLEYLAREYEESGQIPFSELHGAFSVFIKKPEGQIIAFTDNSHMHAIFISDNAISDSFISLVQYLHNNAHAKLHFLPEAIAQNYSVGRIFFSKTLIEEIMISNPFMCYVVEDERIRTERKGVNDIGYCDHSFEVSTFFDDLSFALSDINTSVALTGGYDSRLIFTFLKNRMKVLPSLSGDNCKHRDIIVSKEVADCAGYTLNLVNVTKPEITDEQVRNMFHIHDGIFGCLRPEIFRLYEFYQSLADIGIKLHITGDGGVLHKDWEWMQDLPFYNKKKTDLYRFYEQRLAFNRDTKDAGDYILSEIEQMKNTIVDQLRVFKMETNTQSYDMLYYHVNGPHDWYFSMSICGVDLYSPLLEKDFVSYSYALPRFQRFFYNNMRNLTSKEDAAIARIPTYYGTTESNEFRMIVRDVWFQLIEYVKKLIRMIGRKVRRKTYFTSDVITWSIEQDLRNLKISQQAVDYCKKVGIIQAQTSMQSLSAAHIMCALEIYLLAEYAGLL